MAKSAAGNQGDGTDRHSLLDLNDFSTDKNYSLRNLLEFNKENLDQYCFELVNAKIEDYDSEENVESETKMYVQIKKKEYYMNNEKRTMLSIVDISKSIMYEDVHAQNEFLAITNATVSHELRNPL